MAETYLLWGRRSGARRADLLWPVEMHRVRVPAFGASLNLFQEVLLRLLQTGIKDLDELSRLSALDRQLVAFILAKELQPHQWIDHRFDLTKKGIAALEGRASEDGAERVVFAFWDAVGARWMPFLSERPPEISPMDESALHPRFLIDLDSGRQVSPFMIRRPPGQGRPKRDAIGAAMEQFQRELTRDGGEGTANLAALEFLDEPPQSARLWVQTFVVEGDPYPWLVSDPYRPDRPDGAMRKALAKLMLSDARLEAWMGSRLALRAASKEEQDAEVAAAQLLDEQVSALIRQTDDPALELIREYTARVLRLAQRLRSEAVVLPEDLSSAVVHSGSCLEALLQWMLLKWPAVVDQWPKYVDKRALRRSLSELPLAEPLSGSCIGALESQRDDSLRKAALRRNQPMKALLAAALLSIYDDESHPLRQAPINALDWNLIGLRNKGGHATHHRLERAPVLEFTEMTLRWVELFKHHY